MKISKRIGWFAMALLAFVVCLVLQLLGSVIAVLIMEGSLDEAAITKSAGFATLFAHVLTIIAFSLWYRLSCGRLTFKEIKGVFAPKTLLTVALIAVGLCFLVRFVLLALELSVPSVQEFMNIMFEQTGLGINIMATIAAVLIGPVGEELVYRGVAFYYAKKMVADLEDNRKAFWIANILQALLFGVCHLNIVQSTYAFIIGLALGYLTHRYRSIMPAIITHILFNAMGSFLWQPLGIALPENYMVYFIGAVICLGVTIVGLRMSKVTKN